VHGTPAEPGPGTRVVVDTDDKLTIGSGVLNMLSHSTPAHGDPTLWYGAITRVAGRVYIAKMKLTGSAKNQFGFDTNQVTDFGISHYFYFNPLTNITVRVATSSVPVGVAVAETDYYLAIVLRATGAHYFIKGGAFTEWTNLFPSNVTSTATLYPGLHVGNAANIQQDVDFIRIPQELWLPVPMLSDSFDRANGVLGITDGAGHAEANGGGGLAWNNRVGTTQIATNVASASALVGGIAIATVDTGNINILHEAETTRSAGNVGIVLRYADADNYVYAIHDGTNAKLIKRVATSETDVIAAVVAYAAGAVMRVICDGTSFSLFYNNAKVGSTSTISDAGLQTGTEVGVYSSDTGNSQDDCVAWSRTGYSKLNRF
jgi:hypothetical protein